MITPYFNAQYLCDHNFHFELHDPYYRGYDQIVTINYVLVVDAVTILAWNLNMIINIFTADYVLSAEQKLRDKVLKDRGHWFKDPLLGLIDTGLTTWGDYCEATSYASRSQWHSLPGVIRRENK